MLLLRHGSFAALLLAAAASISAAALPVPVTVEARFVTQPPKLDGVLDDECWQGLPDWTGFFDAQTRQPAPLQTVARTCYDKEDVYVAFHAANLVPGTIRAAETKRNGKLEGDDTVAVRIDSMHQHRYWSMFVVSAIGTQAEYLERSSSTNIGYKGDWQAAAKIVEDGYNVEMAIPFSLLVYGNRQDTFGICFVRYLAAEQIAGPEWDQRHSVLCPLEGSQPARPQTEAEDACLPARDDGRRRIPAGLQRAGPEVYVLQRHSCIDLSHAGFQHGAAAGRVG